MLESLQLVRMTERSFDEVVEVGGEAEELYVHRQCKRASGHQAATRW